jgi:hypothetical protein
MTDQKTTGGKRQKERQRAEKRQQKEQKKAQRKAEKPVRDESQGDPDIAGIRLGPQPIVE